MYSEAVVFTISLLLDSLPMSLYQFVLLCRTVTSQTIFCRKIFLNYFLNVASQVLSYNTRFSEPCSLYYNKNSRACKIKVKKNTAKTVYDQLLNVGSKNIVISQNRSNWKRYSQEDFCRDWSNNVKQSLVAIFWLAITSLHQVSRFTKIRYIWSKIMTGNYI